jgi:hypothetical protein
MTDLLGRCILNAVGPRNGWSVTSCACWRDDIVCLWPRDTWWNETWSTQRLRLEWAQGQHTGMSGSGWNLFSRIPMLTSRGAVVSAGTLLKNAWSCSNAITARSSFVKLLYTLKAQWTALECRTERSVWLLNPSTWSWAYVGLWRSHSVDQARVGPKLKHRFVSQLQFESGTSLNENHSHLRCDNPRDAPVWQGTDCTYDFQKCMNVYVTRLRILMSLTTNICTCKWISCVCTGVT